MSTHQHSNPDAELNLLEDQLRTLVPAPPQLDRDRIMFEAGLNQAGGERNQWINWPGWPVATVALAALCLFLGLSKSAPGPGQAGPMVASSKPSVPPLVPLQYAIGDDQGRREGSESTSYPLVADSVSSEFSLGKLREVIVRQGWDGMPGGISGNQIPPSSITSLGSYRFSPISR